MTATASHIRGFTLVELMVAMVAGLIVSAAALSFFFSSMKSNGEYVQSTRLTQELRNTLDLITRDLRRAGYDDEGLKYLGNTNTSPFTPACLTANGAPTTCLSAGVGDCIIYAYDRSYPNGTTTLAGTPGTLDLSNGEARAMRLRTYTVGENSNVGVIEYFDSSINSARPLCGDTGPAYSAGSTYPGCNNATGWCPLSDPTRINVTALNITNNSVTLGAGTTAQIVRQFDINIIGRLTAVGDTAYTRNVQTTVKIRSDCMRAVIANCYASP